MKKKIALFLGTGGVGKTSLSALYALKKDNKRLLITIDPSKRLKDLFSEDKPANLEISLSEREKLFLDFLDKHIEEKGLLNRFKENSLFKSLMKNLSVSQEFTSFYELVKYFNDEKIDQIILDTPPLQNSTDFFKGAELLESLFSGRLVSFFIPDEKRGFLSRMMNRGREVALGALSKLTGSEFIRELSEFFEVSQKVRLPLLETLASAKRIILEESEVFLVSSYEELSLMRLESSILDLRKRGFKIQKCLINRYSVDGESLVKTRLEKMMQELAINFSDITFIKIDEINQEPNNMAKLIDWSKSVTF